MNKMWYDDYEKYDELSEMDRHDLIHIIYDLEKAFDKACKKLELNHAEYLTKNYKCIRTATKEQWKAWAMKDE